MWPDPLTPGIDCVRDMGKPKLAADLDLVWPDRGEVVLGRNGRLEEVPQEPEVGEDGFGSVERRGVGGFLTVLESE